MASESINGEANLPPLLEDLKGPVESICPVGSTGVENKIYTPLKSLPDEVPPLGQPSPVAVPLPQIITRKRSSLSSVPKDAASLTAPPPVPEPAPGPPLVETAQPPKKKKKYTPKPKAPKTAIGPKPKKAPSKPKAKKQSTSKKSKKGKIESADGIQTNGVEMTSGSAETSTTPQPPLPPLKLHLPKLIKMPQMPNLEPPHSLHGNDDHQDNDNGDELSDNADGYQNVQPDIEGENGGTSGGKPSRKKKSKGRNGNIYIGVFNRIEWMKLQNEFGFQSVNNFGTFVLQTMRKIHGDINFWCDLAKASGVYPDLEKYVWTNGFPHAVNTEGQTYAPPEIQLSDDKQLEVIELAKVMWDQRLQQLQQQEQLSQSNSGESGNAPGGSGVGVVPEEGDEEDEEDVEDPGVENYLENMANGQYSPGDDEVEYLSAEQITMIWNNQMNSAQSMERYGKLLSYINSIEDGEQVEQDDKPVEEI